MKQYVYAFYFFFLILLTKTLFSRHPYTNRSNNYFNPILFKIRTATIRGIDSRTNLASTSSTKKKKNKGIDFDSIYIRRIFCLFRAVSGGRL